MHQLLDDYLCKKYPKIFADRHKPMTETCLCWGLSVGNGWFSLLDNLCHNIQYHIDNPPWVENKKTGKFKKPKKPTCSQLVADQVKEKFSSLRFYYHGGDEYCRALVGQSEDLSFFICEECGRMDDDVGRNKKGWIVTTCREHARNPNDFTPNNHSELGKIWEQVRDDEKKKKIENEKWKKEWKKKEKGNRNAYDLMFDTPKNESK